MIGWCYAKNGDLAMALRSDATLSRLILEQEMREIGILNPQISQQQQEVLEKACNQGISYKKDFFLYGNTGAGKTVIGAEVVKIKMAQWIRNSVIGTVLILTYHDNKEALSNGGVSTHKLRGVPILCGASGPIRISLTPHQLRSSPSWLITSRAVRNS